MSEQQEAWLAEVLQLVHECRLLAAKLTYDKLLGSLEQTPNPPLLARVQAAAASSASAPSARPAATAGRMRSPQP